MTVDPNNNDLLPLLGQILVDQADVIESLIQRLLESGDRSEELLATLAKANDGRQDAMFIKELLSAPGLQLARRPI